jgi:hypothetical protein
MQKGTKTTTYSLDWDTVMNLESRLLRDFQNNKTKDKARALLMISIGVKLFIIDNLKVKRMQKNNKECKKYIGINIDLEDFLIELGMNEKIGTDEYILYPNRTSTTKTIMTDLSRGFSHYKEGAGIKKDISLSNLRKTYLTWHHQVLGDDTGLVSSHSTTQVLEKYYLDPKVLTAVEISALKVRVFGKK